MKTADQIISEKEEIKRCMREFAIEVLKKMYEDNYEEMYYGESTGGDHFLDIDKIISNIIDENIN